MLVPPGAVGAAHAAIAARKDAIPPPRPAVRSPGPVGAVNDEVEARTGAPPAPISIPWEEAPSRAAPPTALRMPGAMGAIHAQIEARKGGGVAPIGGELAPAQSSCWEEAPLMALQMPGAMGAVHAQIEARKGDEVATVPVWSESDAMAATAELVPLVAAAAADASASMWEEVVDEDTGEQYFYNRATGESSWIDPSTSAAVDSPADWVEEGAALPFPDDTPSDWVDPAAAEPSAEALAEEPPTLLAVGAAHPSPAASPAPAPAGEPLDFGGLDLTHIMAQAASPVTPTLATNGAAPGAAGSDPLDDFGGLDLAYIMAQAASPVTPALATNGAGAL